MDSNKSYFLGYSTPDGFVTHVRDDISSHEFITYIIKGGPGTGKSSMMKRIAKELEALEEPELYYCSSDPASLDAVIFRKAGVIIIDGTAPHVVEPEYPGVKQVLVDLGECWNIDLLQRHTEDVIRETVNNKKYHSLVKRYLKAIHSLNDDTYKVGETAVMNVKLDAYCSRLSSRLFPTKKGTKGKIEYRQLTALTPIGVVTQKGVFENAQIFYIDDPCKTVADKILKKLAYSASKAGYNATVSCDVLYSDEVLQHVMIPELNLIFTSLKPEISSKINALRFYDPAVLREKRKRIVFNKGIAGELVKEAVSALNTAKIIHDELEAYYISAMDFTEVGRRAEKLISSIKNKMMS